MADFPSLQEPCGLQTTVQNIGDSAVYLFGSMPAPKGAKSVSSLMSEPPYMWDDPWLKCDNIPVSARTKPDGALSCSRNHIQTTTSPSAQANVGDHSAIKVSSQDHSAMQAVETLARVLLSDFQTQEEPITNVDLILEPTVTPAIQPHRMDHLLARPHVNCYNPQTGFNQVRKPFTVKEMKLRPKPSARQSSSSTLRFRTETKTIYVCTYANCNKRFSRLPDLQRHHRGSHDGAKTFKCHVSGCERADRGFPRKDKRDDHERKMHKDLDDWAQEINRDSTVFSPILSDELKAT